MRASRLVTMGIGLALGFAALMSCSDESGGTSNDCTEGTEGCPCYGNGTCDGNLDCVQGECRAAGTGGTGNGGSAGSSTGGAQPTGGTAGSSGQGGSAGMAQGGTSGGPSGGSAGQSGDGASGGTSGSSGTAGSAGQTCGDTSSDWQNCGACGRRCDNGGMSCGSITSTDCCVGGVCAPFFGPCFAEADDFTTCTEACASIGETCVAGACGAGWTWEGWSSGEGDRCVALTTSQVSNQAACDTVLPWTPSAALKRCCCTDTQ